MNNLLRTRFMIKKDPFIKRSRGMMYLLKENESEVCFLINNLCCIFKKGTDKRINYYESFSDSTLYGNVIG